MSVNWSKLTDEEKGPYNDQSDKDKVRYKKEIDVYNTKKAAELITKSQSNTQIIRELILNQGESLSFDFIFDSPGISKTPITNMPKTVTPIKKII